ncbi:hypothetical protein DYB37_007485 [Aphanomyces astaci]|uniref:Uncharacterized protein n=1 Tax=Aphanomyces astaci TaxID=112090 RepID=A0A3R7F3P1_APHAT|nr:hypothetical protein DYB35_006246 [Aphanomyces astaci]RHZ23144.1 hypothetical protein DYB37_007485 [Aphanomyces astaci]
MSAAVVLLPPTLQCVHSSKAWSLRCTWDEGGDNIVAYTVDLFACRHMPPSNPSADLVEGTYVLHSLDIPDVAVYRATPSSPIVFDIVPPPPVNGVVLAYVVQLRASTANMDTKDVVFATQQAGFLALLHLAQQYPQHANVASHVAAAIVRIMQRHRQSPEQGRSGEGSSSSSDDDDDVCEPGAMHNPDVVSDLVNVMLKRMESFAGDVNMQRWGLRAVSCILLREHGKPPDAAFQGAPELQNSRI